VTGPSLLSIRNYSCHALALTTFFNHPGDEGVCDMKVGNRRFSFFAA